MTQFQWLYRYYLCIAKNHSEYIILIKICNFFSWQLWKCTFFILGALQLWHIQTFPAGLYEALFFWMSIPTNPDGHTDDDSCGRWNTGAGADMSSRFVSSLWLVWRQYLSEMLMTTLKAFYILLCVVSILTLWHKFNI